MKRRGLSLAETVLSLFLLAFSIILCTNLFHVGLRYSGRVEQEAVATLIAQKKLAEIRAWASTRVPGGFHFDDWTPYANFTTNDPDQPGYLINVVARPAPLLDPCTSFGALFLPANQTRLQASYQKVTATVTWGAGPGIALTTLIGDPVREWRVNTPLVITQISLAGNPLPRSQDAVFKVEGYDSDNRLIPDLMYNWYVVPLTGNGTITNQSPGHSQVTLTHKIRLLNGNWGFAPGPSSCALRARSIFRGQERTVDVVVNLAP